MDLRGAKMTVNEALDILIKSVPNAAIPKVAWESDNKFIFNTAPEDDKTIFYDSLYSIDRSTGEVKLYNPLDEEENPFDIYKPIDVFYRK